MADRSTTSPSPTAPRSRLPPTPRATGEVEIPAGGLSFICSVPGHADAGMRGDVMVSTEPAASAEPSASVSAEDLRDADAARTAQFPAETRGQGKRGAGPDDPGRRHQAMGADRIGYPVGDRAWRRGRGLRLQPDGPRTPDPRAGRRPRSRRPAQRAAGADHDPLPRAGRAERGRRRAGHHPAGGHARRDVHVRVHGAERRQPHVSQPLHGGAPGADGPAGRLHRDRSRQRTSRMRTSTTP